MPRIDWENVFVALQNEQRRRLLLTLRTQESQDDRVTSLRYLHDGESDFERFKTNMYHRHLPLLRRRGYVDWDQENHEVSRGSNFSEVEPVLELVEDRDDDRSIELVRQ
jgi:hypothetical protein